MAKNQDMLIEILLDSNASLAERDDAAIDLSNFDEDAVLVALIEVGTNEQEDEVLLASCGESIAEIILKRKIKPGDILQKLAIPAQNEAKALIEAKSS